ncbi:cyclic nucleotide-binding domain-containing protein [candidate division KSB1 bacterium]
MAEELKDYLIETRIRLLDKFTDKEKKELFTNGSIGEFQMHDRIVSENDNDLCIYIILEGEVSIWRKNVPVTRLKKGDTFNETKLFLPAPNKISVMAESQTTILKLERECLMDFFHRKPERLFKIFTLNILATMFKKLEDYEEILVSHYFKTLKYLHKD